MTGTDTAAEPAGADPAPADPVRAWTLRVLAVLGLMLVLQIVSDRTAPVTSIGTVEALVIPISARVAGEVAEAGVRDDRVVKAGDMLFRIDPTPMRLAVDAAEARVASAGQSIGASTAQVVSAQAKVADQRAALSNMRAQSERTIELVSKGVLAASRGDTALNDLKRAEASVEAAEAELRRSRESLGPEGDANPQLRAAIADLENARFNLARTTVVSPTDGYVSGVRLGVGQYAQPGQPLMNVVDLGSAWVIAYFRENQLENIALGDPVEMTLDIRPGEVLRGRVVGFGAGVATINQQAPAGGLVQTPASGKWLSAAQRHPVRIAFEGEGIPRKVRVGSQVTALVRTESSGPLAPLWWLWIRSLAVLSYVY